MAHDGDNGSAIDPSIDGAMEAIYGLDYSSRDD